MASHSYPTHGFNLRQELGINEIIKKSQAYLVYPGRIRRRPFCPPLFSKSMNIKDLRLSSSSSVLCLNQKSVKPVNILLSSNRANFNESVSTASESHMLKSSTRSRKISSLIPRFQRFDNELIREKDLYRRNHLHACEILISLMISNEQDRKLTMLSLKKSSRDLAEFLTRFSIGLAGTGLAVFFSVINNIGVPFCANKVFDITLSVSLLLLSWSISQLREAIVKVNKKAIKEDEETTTNRVERRIKDIYFRAAMVFIMIALRFG